MTLFEKIVAREIPAKIVHEEDDLLAFADIAPQAPVHILIVPKQVIPRIGEATAQQAPLLGRMLIAAGKIAREMGIDESGFRIVINHGNEGGETVPHLHMHLLGGRQMTWPPG
ncbi:MAG TPA: histidine triad nucleotide-binding protein [Chthoniobacteraceae bacterium]|nr:histidine triad nucleotide-binding protein [Chthoniobacteraceae bacterium]